MRISTVLSITFAATPTIISAAGTLGFALGTKNPDGSCKYTADYEADLDAISATTGSRVVRTYSASDCNAAQQLLPAAKSKGFEVVLGVWPDVDASFNADKNAIQTYATQYSDQVAAVTVGSEALYRGSLTAPALLNRIDEVKSIVPNIKVGTADSWNKYADGTADPLIQGGVELFYVNAFAYWQGQDISNATATFLDDIMQAFGHIQSVSGSLEKPELWVGETGWPSDGGDNYGFAESSTKNAETYFHQAICGMTYWGVNVFAFEAFDEPWKPKSVGDSGAASDETHWGVMFADRRPKFPVDC